jgi:hypothetical protein
MIGHPQDFEWPAFQLLPRNAIYGPLILRPARVDGPVQCA